MGGSSSTSSYSRETHHAAADHRPCFGSCHISLRAWLNVCARSQFVSAFTSVCLSVPFWEMLLREGEVHKGGGAKCARHKNLVHKYGSVSGRESGGRVQLQVFQMGASKATFAAPCSAKEWNRAFWRGGRRGGFFSPSHTHTRIILTSLSLSPSPGPLPNSSKSRGERGDTIDRTWPETESLYSLLLKTDDNNRNAPNVPHNVSGEGVVGWWSRNFWSYSWGDGVEWSWGLGWVGPPFSPPKRNGAASSSFFHLFSISISLALARPTWGESGG